MLTKHLIIISFDAVSSKDIEILKELPNFSKLIESGSIIKNVESIYPTLTYPAHATIVTGKYPSNHGVINNTFLEPFSKTPDWYWYRKYINGETLYDLAEAKGLKSCSVLWPVSGRSNITYNMPEICCTKPYHNQIFMSAFAGSLKYQLTLNNKFGHIRKGISQPYLDNFVNESAKFTIFKYKPNLMLIHFCDVDSHKHYTGTDSSDTKAALLRHDIRLGEIIEALKNANIYDNSTIIALGDHSSLNADKTISLNSLLFKYNLLSVNKNGEIKDYSAIAKSCDGSSYIYLKNKDDMKTKEYLLHILNDLKSEENSPIEFFLNSKEAKEMGADPNCSFMLEAKLGYYFIDELTENFIQPVNSNHIGEKLHRMKATHGYHPQKEDYTTFLIANGQGIKKNTVIDKGHLINHGPTFAKLLGLSFSDTDGVVEYKILSI